MLMVISRRECYSPYKEKKRKNGRGNIALVLNNNNITSMIHDDVVSDLCANVN